MKHFKHRSLYTGLIVAILAGVIALGACDFLTPPFAQDLDNPLDPKASVSPAVSPTATPTPTPVASVEPSPDTSVEPSPSPSPTPTPTPDPSVEPSVEPSPSPSPTPTPTPDPSVEPSVEPSPSPSPTPTPTPEPSVEPSVEPSPSPSPSPTPTPIPLPAAPSGVSASGGNKQVVLGWNAVEGADGYKVFYAAGSTASTASTPADQSMITGTQATLTGLATGTAYAFVVVASNASGDGPASAVVTATTSGSIGVTINPPSGTSLVINMPSVAANFSRADTLTVSPTVTGSPDSYQWYRNGVPISGQTSKDLSLSLSNLPVGRHQFTLIAARGNTLASAGFTITLQ